MAGEAASRASAAVATNKPGIPVSCLQPACKDAEAPPHKSSDREALADYENVASECCDQVSWPGKESPCQAETKHSMSWCKTP